MKKTTVLLVVLALAAVSSAASLTDWLHLEQLQQSPVAFGLRADGGYRLNGQDTSRLSYGLSAELLFPLVSTARLRAHLITLTLSGSGALSFNSGLSMDVLVGLPVRRAAVWPYAYVGGGFDATEKIDSYSLRGGVGIEGRVQKYSHVFAEAGLANSYPRRTTRVRAGAGVRFGL